MTVNLTNDLSSKIYSYDRLLNNFLKQAHIIDLDRVYPISSACY